MVCVFWISHFEIIRIHECSFFKTTVEIRWRRCLEVPKGMGLGNFMPF